MSLKKNFIYKNINVPTTNIHTCCIKLLIKTEMHHKVVFE